MSQRQQSFRLSLIFCTALFLLTGRYGYSQSPSSTHGVNYDFADTTHHPDYISFAQLAFSAHALVGPAKIPVILENGPPARANGSSCSGPCTRPSPHEYLNCTINAGLATCRLNILRFSQFGQVTAPFAFQWAIVMAEGESLAGTMSAALDSTGALVYPAEAELGGRMVVTVQLDGQPAPIVLRSRKEPRFRSQILGWPPYGSEFTLSNPPIEYYQASQIDDPAAVPFMIVTSNDVRIGTEKSAFFEARPKILGVKPTDSGDGLEITWLETAGSVPGVTIARYHIYRNLTPGTLAGWQRIATLPAGTSSYIDRSVPSGVPADYVISHATDYPFGIEYEGIFDPPTTYRP